MNSFNDAWPKQPMNTEQIQGSVMAMFSKVATQGEAIQCLLNLREENVTLEQVLLAFSDEMNLPAGKIKDPNVFDEDSRMPFGKYAGSKMKDLPGSYLAWLFHKGDDFSHKPIAKFIKSYRPAKEAYLSNPIDEDMEFEF